jgi:hypothetical protein
VLDDAVMERASLIGEFDSAARAVNQSGAETRFKFRDRFADAGLRHAEPLSGSAEAACLGNGRENDQATYQSTINFVHTRCLLVI